jgi:hypothetical protein
VRRCLHWEEEYVVPVMPSGLLEQPLSRSLNAVVVGLGVPEDVLVGFEAIDELKAASLVSALLARFASTPVPAASPMTAADRRPMMQESMNTSRLHPHITPLDDFFVVASFSGCPEKPDEVPAVIALSVYGLL